MGWSVVEDTRCQRIWKTSQRAAQLAGAAIARTPIATTAMPGVSGCRGLTLGRKEGGTKKKEPRQKLSLKALYIYTYMVSLMFARAQDAIINIKLTFFNKVGARERERARARSRARNKL